VTLKPPSNKQKSPLEGQIWGADLAFRAWPFFLFLCCTGCATAWANESTTREAALVRMVRQDCGSCHGMTLQGGLGPALLPENLKGKPVDLLTHAIYYGRTGTPMPPWRQFITMDEATWISNQLLNGFPP
jgi:cytochrome c55X